MAIPNAHMPFAAYGHPRFHFATDEIQANGVP
jgi:hypothetical protein